MTKTVREQLKLTLEQPTQSEFEFLQTIAALTGELGRGPTLRELADVYSFRRQRAHYLVAKLRRKGFVEDQPGPTWPGVTLAHNGKLVLEIGLGAQVRH